MQRTLLHTLGLTGMMLSCLMIESSGFKGYTTDVSYPVTTAVYTRGSSQYFCKGHVESSIQLISSKNPGIKRPCTLNLDINCHQFKTLDSCVVIGLYKNKIAKVPKITGFNYKGITTDFDVRTPRVLTERQLTKGLRFTEAAYAGLIIKASEKFGVNAEFLAAVLAQESGWCRFPVSNNNFGSDWSGKYIDYDTPEDGIAGAAKTLSNNFLRQTSNYFHGFTVKDVNIDYCVNNDGSTKTDWAIDVVSMMKQIYSRALE